MNRFAYALGAIWLGSELLVKYLKARKRCPRGMARNGGNNGGGEKRTQRALVPGDGGSTKSTVAQQLLE